MERTTSNGTPLLKAARSKNLRLKPGVKELDFYLKEYGLPSDT